MTVRLRNRRRLRLKEVEETGAALAEGFGVRLFQGSEPVDRAEAGDFDVLLFQGRVWGIVLKDEEGVERVAPAVRAILPAPPTRSHVTVDMGAVRFVNNGADVMAPGIVDADASIRPGDPVWVRDERNKRPLAIGVALAAGPELPGKATGKKGKVVKTLHWVGDELWNLEI